MSGAQATVAPAIEFEEGWDSASNHESSLNRADMINLTISIKDLPGVQYPWNAPGSLQSFLRQVVKPDFKAKIVKGIHQRGTGPANNEGNLMVHYNIRMLPNDYSGAWDHIYHIYVGSGARIPNHQMNAAGLSINQGVHFGTLVTGVSVKTAPNMFDFFPAQFRMSGGTGLRARSSSFSSQISVGNTRIG
ncbi:hypothetical protein [Plastoroseomonas hellenica]|uniref:hypothetical protein n=1 Tax=Plastoroseomonas hellenica TaxID=2687306 RepID=UPI001BA52717|nr:hypothetical protein [Plastoroseomonas hellenica]MBR0641323.1 hypothetical protein [Plastoroseomonas hellenica]